MNKGSMIRNPLLLSLSISSVALGFMLAVQYRVAQHTNQQVAVGTGDSQIASLQSSVANIQKKNQELEAQIEQYNKEKTKFETKAGNQDKDLLAELDKARIEAGTTPVIGSGITFSISDDPTLQAGNDSLDHYVHDQDVRKLLSELYLAGAEAISINGQRITYTSRIQCIGPTIIIDNHKSTVPFKFQAIGDRTVLSKSLNIPNGILDWMRLNRKLKVEPVKEETIIKMPAYTGTFNNILDPSQTQKIN